MTLVGTYAPDRPLTRVHTRFPRSDLMFYATSGWVLSTVRFWWVKVLSREPFALSSGRLKASRKSPLVKPLSPTKLVYINDGSIMPSIHSLVREHFALTARFRFLPLRTRDFLISHPASRIEGQSLPRGCRFLVPTHQVRNFTSHHQISYVVISYSLPIPSLLSFGQTGRTPLLIYVYHNNRF